MRSSDLRGWTAALVGVLVASSTRAAAQPPLAQGFAVERFYPSAPGGGWLVMDDLDLRGDLGGAIGMTTSYAHAPLDLADGAHRLAVVSDEAFADFAFAATYDRWRLYLDLDMPLAIKGDGGTAGGYTFAAPSVDPGPDTDTLSDLRLGFDGRLLGEPGGAFRLGAGAQLLVPEGRRSDYDTDGTPRAMFRALVAGDVGLFTYAAQLGVHVRPLDDTPTPGSPRGNEVLFGIAAGARLRLGDAGTSLIIGTEVYGETAVRSLLGSDATGVEGLLSTRVEAPLHGGPLLRVRLGTGPGIDAHFGAPEWRAVVGIEVTDRVRAR